MGTRADFYVGIGKDAEWIGSIAYDGYRIEEATLEMSYENIDSMECWAIKSATDETAFRNAVSKLLSMNDDGTTPDLGWPWPWPDARTTDRSYVFADGRCQCFHWGARYNPRTGKKINDGPEWPDMTSK